MQPKDSEQDKAETGERGNDTVALNDAEEARKRNGNPSQGGSEESVATGHGRGGNEELADPQD
ncbi:hypothetical protein [uncultured Xylophilus sp.]|uniref:hypothetical protein n=1 Tax=uncultured Xylophilus sp. TaxID=296832 RepID=UPI0025FF4AC2|nr:hypothetical protein [uncultured Xylophilus sp.]